MKVAAKICSILLYVEIAVIVALAAASMLPAVFGNKAYVVETASMTPSIPVGSMAYINCDVEGEDIQDGDVIAFYINGSDEKVCIHRAVSNNESDQLIVTKGDANATEDVAPVPYASVVGKLDTAVPYLGTLCAYGVEKAYLLAIVVVLTAAAAYGFEAASKRGHSQINQVGQQELQNPID